MYACTHRCISMLCTHANTHINCGFYLLDSMACRNCGTRLRSLLMVSIIEQSVSACQIGSISGGVSSSIVVGVLSLRIHSTFASLAFVTIPWPPFVFCPAPHIPQFSPFSGLWLVEPRWWSCWQLGAFLFAYEGIVAPFLGIKAMHIGITSFRAN